MTDDYENRIRAARGDTDRSDTSLVPTIGGGVLTVLLGVIVLGAYIEIKALARSVRRWLP